MQLLSSLSSKISFSGIFLGRGAWDLFYFLLKQQGSFKWDVSDSVDKPQSPEGQTIMFWELFTQNIIGFWNDISLLWWWCSKLESLDFHVVFITRHCRHKTGIWTVAFDAVPQCQSLEGILTSSGVRIRDPWAAPIPSTACVLYRGL